MFVRGFGHTRLLRRFPILSRQDLRPALRRSSSSRMDLRIEDLNNQSMQIHRQFGDLMVEITHHLPDKNWGRELIHTGKQEDFDRLVTGPHASIAVYGHIH